MRLPKIDIYSKTEKPNDLQTNERFYVERKDKRTLTRKQGFQYIQRFIERQNDEHGDDIQDIKIQVMTPIGLRSIVGSKAGIEAFLNDQDTYYESRVAKRGKFKKIHSIHFNVIMNN